MEDAEHIRLLGEEVRSLRADLARAQEAKEQAITEGHPVWCLTLIRAGDAKLAALLGDDWIRKAADELERKSFMEDQALHSDSIVRILQEKRKEACDVK